MVGLTFHGPYSTSREQSPPGDTAVPILSLRTNLMLFLSLLWCENFHRIPRRTRQYLAAGPEKQKKKHPSSFFCNISFLKKYQHN